jgi:hypothetical protein
MTLTRERMERAIRGYFDACNRADGPGIVSYFTLDAVHYFPEGGPYGALRGAKAIADCWVKCVRDLGSWWTVDRVIADPAQAEAVIEWTHFKPKVGQVLRGDEWYKFAPDGRIMEIKAYYACPTHAGVARHEIGGFDYKGRGYPLEPPPAAMVPGRG